VGNDVNELSKFLARVKTQPMNAVQVSDVRRWVARAVPQMSFRFPRSELQRAISAAKTHNLNSPAARPLKKALAGAILATDGMCSSEAKAFARCALLRLGQWHLDGRRTSPSLCAARAKLPQIVEEMLTGIKQFSSLMTRHPPRLLPPTLIAADAAFLHAHDFFSTDENQVHLVVTSPPYPGVHVLYHRWQINGRREAPAPYWISATNDGHGAAHYNFADRRGSAIDRYFEVSLRTLRSIRRVMKPGALMVQMVAFAETELQFPRYLDNMTAARFREVPLSGSEQTRIWRDVPGRKWHATLQGNTSSSREVVLVHEAI
jgi:hypothetical protein